MAKRVQHFLGRCPDEKPWPEAGTAPGETPKAGGLRTPGGGSQGGEDWRSTGGEPEPGQG